ncbi:MAG: hypothetical protein HY305_05355 [Sphingobacteriales bacterium]|nr:hypothetical protein [Sphingobacteriales bacterium]
MHLFTLDDLIEYLYHETYPEKTAAIQDALQSDLKLREKYESVLAIYKRLKSIPFFSPEKKTVNAVLAYAISK